MRFIWNSENIAHIAAHGISPEQVEAAFGSADFGCQPSRFAKFIGEGTIGRGLVRIAYYQDGDEIYPVTAHLIRKRKTAPGDHP